MGLILLFQRIVLISVEELARKTAPKTLIAKYSPKAKDENPVRLSTVGWINLQLFSYQLLKPIQEFYH